MFPAQIEEIRRLRRVGHTCRETAGLVGCSKSSVQRISPGPQRHRCPTCGGMIAGRRCRLCELGLPETSTPGARMRPAGA